MILLKGGEGRTTAATAFKRDLFGIEQREGEEEGMEGIEMQWIVMTGLAASACVACVHEEKKKEEEEGHV